MQVACVQVACVQVACVSVNVCVCNQGKIPSSSIQSIGQSDYFPLVTKIFAGINNPNYLILLLYYYLWVLHLAILPLQAGVIL